MGAFNQWVRGSFLEKPDNRRALTVAMNLLYGAAVITRVNWIRIQGVSIPPSFLKSTPLKLSDIEHNLQPEE